MVGDKACDVEAGERDGACGSLDAEGRLDDLIIAVLNWTDAVRA